MESTTETRESYLQTESKPPILHGQGSFHTHAVLDEGVNVNFLQTLGYHLHQLINIGFTCNQQQVFAYQLYSKRFKYLKLQPRRPATGETTCPPLYGLQFTDTAAQF